MVSDGREHVTSNLIGHLADEFSLSAVDRNQLLPSGRQPTIDNRTAWAVTYLVEAVALERTGRGKIRITDRGRAILAESPTSIDYRFLMKFQEFQEFREASSTRSAVATPVTPEAGTPEEQLEANYQTLRGSLAQDLLVRIKDCSPRFFEELVVDLLVAMGYGGSRKDAGQAVGQSGDGGIDGIIKEDRLGLDVVYIQAKRWEASVGRPTIQAFSGSLDGFKAKKGVIITTSQFTDDAKEYAERIEKRIVLIDGQLLTQLMIDHGVGVTHVTSYEVKRIDLDYFPETE
jgi:restriction system protein